jgi:hypothetical protein
MLSQLPPGGVDTVAAALKSSGGTPVFELLT